MICDVCGATMPDLSYTGEEICPGCGAVWGYDEGVCLKPDSIKALLARVKAEAMEECAAFADAKAEECRECPGSLFAYAADARCDEIAAAIRARAEEVRADK
jgi:hypothetical protein